MTHQLQQLLHAPLALQDCDEEMSPLLPMDIPEHSCSLDFRAVRLHAESLENNDSDFDYTQVFQRYVPSPEIVSFIVNLSNDEVVETCGRSFTHLLRGRISPGDSTGVIVKETRIALSRIGLSYSQVLLKTQRVSMKIYRYTKMMKQQLPPLPLGYSNYLSDPGIALIPNAVDGGLAMVLTKPDGQSAEWGAKTKSENMWTLMNSWLLPDDFCVSLG